MNFFCLRDGNVSKIAVIIVSIAANWGTAHHFNQSINQSINQPNNNSISHQSTTLFMELNIRPDITIGITLHYMKFKKKFFSSVKTSSLWLSLAEDEDVFRQRSR